MDILVYEFSTSGVKTSLLLPPLVAMVISFFTSMGGVSGAFLLLPFQMSILGYTTPSVSATNFVYNLVSIPGGVLRFIREGRMAWPLTWIIVAGTLPGVFIGYLIRVVYLPDPRPFKLFVGCVLLYIGIRLLHDLTPWGKEKRLANKAMEQAFNKRMLALRRSREEAKEQEKEMASVRTTELSLKRVVYEFWGETYSYGTLSMFLLAFIVGIIGGTYGIGGGAIIAPFCVAIYKLPVYTVAGASLMGTFVTSVVGVMFYSLLPAGPLPTQPDWLLGALFGIGGLVGIYLGAWTQKYVPQNFIKAMLSMVILYAGLRYILQFF